MGPDSLFEGSRQGLANRDLQLRLKRGEDRAGYLYVSSLLCSPLFAPSLIRQKLAGNCTTTCPWIGRQRFCNTRCFYRNRTFCRGSQNPDRETLGAHLFSPWGSGPIWGRRFGRFRSRESRCRWRYLLTDEDGLSGISRSRLQASRRRVMSSPVSTSNTVNMIHYALSLVAR
jgi:hypothetical protein